MKKPKENVRIEKKRRIDVLPLGREESIAAKLSYQARCQDNRMSQVERDTRRRFKRLPRDLRCPECKRGPLLSSKKWVVLGTAWLKWYEDWQGHQLECNRFVHVAVCKRCWCNHDVRRRLEEKYKNALDVEQAPKGLLDVKPLPEHYCYDGLNYEQRKQRKKSEEKRAKKLEMLPADRVCRICNMLKLGLRQWIIDKNGVAICRSCYKKQEN